MNFDRLRLVAELAGVGAKSEAMLVTTIPERPGAFHAFADAALMQTDIQVTEFKYRCAGACSMLHHACNNLFDLACRDAELGTGCKRFQTRVARLWKLAT